MAQPDVQLVLTGEADLSVQPPGSMGMLAIVSGEMCGARRDVKDR